MNSIRRKLLFCAVFVSAATLLGASRNYQAPWAQAIKNAGQSYEFATIDPPGGFCPLALSINNSRLVTVIYSHDDQCQSQDTILSRLDTRTLLFARFRSRGLARRKCFQNPDLRWN